MFKLKQETMWPVAWFSNRCDLFTANLGCPAIYYDIRAGWKVYRNKHLNIYTDPLSLKAPAWGVGSETMKVKDFDIFRPQDVHVILVILGTGVSNNWSPQHSQQNWFQAAKCIRRFSSFSHWLEKMKADVSTVQSLRIGYRLAVNMFRASPTFPV